MKECPMLPLLCPYVGCNKTCPRCEFDQHTYSCSYGKQYNAEAIMARMAADARAQSAVDTDELYHAALRNKRAAPARSAPSGTAIHHVSFHDTLAGIALRYGSSLSIEFSFVSGMFVSQSLTVCRHHGR